MTSLIPAWVDGVLTPMDKLAVHHRGLRHKAVSVFVTRDDKILLQRRALGKYHTPGLWANTCCTHPDWEETTADCAVRRLRQELGLTGLTPEYRQRIEYRADVGKGMIEDEVVDVFTAIAPAGMEPVANPEEVMDTVWMTLPDLRRDVATRPDAYTPWLRIYLRDHTTAILGADWEAP